MDLPGLWVGARPKFGRIFFEININMKVKLGAPTDQDVAERLLMTPLRQALGATRLHREVSNLEVNCAIGRLMGTRDTKKYRVKTADLGSVSAIGTEVVVRCGEGSIVGLGEDDGDGVWNAANEGAGE